VEGREAERARPGGDARKLVTATSKEPVTMQPFRYIIYLIGSLFTAKPALRDPIPEGEFLDTLATRSGLTRAQVEKVISELFGLFAELARQGIPVPFVLRRFRMLPTSGGSYASPDPDATEVRETLGYSIVVHPDETGKMRADCPVEKTGDAGETGPAVSSVRGRPGNALNKYGVGTAGGTEVNGSGFRDKRADAVWCSAALTDSDGGSAIALTVLDCTPSRLVLGGAPAGTTGLRFLKITDAAGHFTVSDEGLTAL
jgi:hypothetical protein